MVGAVLPISRGVPRTHGSRMDAPAARSALFRFAPPSADAAAASDAGLHHVRDADRDADRPVAAWRGPVLACGVTVAATAGLVFAALCPEDASRRGAAARPRPGAVILSASAEEPVEADGSAAAPVVSALHVWDGRPVRATPTDTLPDAHGADGLTLANDVSVAEPHEPRPDAAQRNRDRIAPAVWLTGEITD